MYAIEEGLQKVTANMWRLSSVRSPAGIQSWEW